MMNIFRDFARDIFGMTAADVPETIPLRILGLAPPMPNRETIVSAFRRRVLEVHPDLQLAYDRPEFQDAAEAVGTRPEIRELVWARDVLVEMAPDPSHVTGKTGASRDPVLPVTPKVKVCRKCQRELGECECYAVGRGRRGGWCWRCVQADDSERAKERRRRRRANRRCARCAARFTPSRSDGRYCSPRCRQAAFRRRVTADKCSRVKQRLPVTTNGESNATAPLTV